MQKLLAKLAKGRKAIVAAGAQVGAAVVLIAPDTSADVKVGLGILAAVISLALVYRIPNKKPTTHVTTEVTGDSLTTKVTHR